MWCNFCYISRFYIQIIFYFQENFNKKKKLKKNPVSMFIKKLAIGPPRQSFYDFLFSQNRSKPRDLKKFERRCRPTNVFFFIRLFFIFFYILVNFLPDIGKYYRILSFVTSFVSIGPMYILVENYLYYNFLTSQKKYFFCKYL